MESTWTKIDIGISDVDLNLVMERDEDLKQLCAIYGVPRELIDVKIPDNGS